MEQLLASVMPLALGAVMSPTMLTAAVLVLSSRTAGRARVWVFTAGGAVTLVGVTLVAPVLSATFSGLNPRVVDWADVALGCVLLALAVWQVLAKHRPTTRAADKAPSRSRVPRPRLARYFGFGVAVTGTDFSSLVLYLAAAKEVARSTLPNDLRLAVLAVPFVAVLLPALIPALLGTVAPRRAASMLSPLARWATAHSRALAVSISTVFGLYLILKGLPPLVR